MMLSPAISAVDDQASPFPGHPAAAESSKEGPGCRAALLEGE